MLQPLAQSAGSQEFVCASRALVRVLDEARTAARSSRPVLLTGETGTGKGRVAQEIHDHSDRRNRPFVIFSAPEGSDSLGLREMFGHVRGAFTGADRDGIGLFEAANTGTLLLDDVDKLSMVLQSALLRFLDSWAVRRVGSTVATRVDVRLIITANRSFSDLAMKNLFLPDLAWRLAGLRIHVPALRERRQDIPPLIEHFAGVHADSCGKAAPKFQRSAMRFLTQQPWPGNVRQLSGIVENIVFRASGSRPISPTDVVRMTSDGFDTGLQAPRSASHRAGVSDEAIVGALQAAQWNSTAASANLGVPLRTLRRRMQKMGLVGRNRKRAATETLAAV